MDQYQFFRSFSRLFDFYAPLPSQRCNSHFDLTLASFLLRTQSCILIMCIFSGRDLFLSHTVVCILVRPLEFFLRHLNGNKQPFHLRHHLFLHYGWFLQNLGKEFIRTNMHTTVDSTFSQIALVIIYFLQAALCQINILCHQ